MKKFIILSSVLIIIFLVFIAMTFLNLGGKISKPTVVPTITPYYPEISPGEAVSTFTKPSASESAEINKYGKVGDLINILPYSGSFFYLDFDFAKNTFVLTLDNNNVEKGNSNFDSFLKKNGIQDRSWIENLLIDYQ